MKRVMASLVALGLVVGYSPLCRASLEYTDAGRVVSTGPYDGPGFGTEDVVIVAGSLAAQAVYSFGSQPVAGGIFSTAMIVWGSLRTAKYRPESVKDAIHANLAEIASRPKPGTVQELLQ